MLELVEMLVLVRRVMCLFCSRLVVWVIVVDSLVGFDMFIGFFLVSLWGVFDLVFCF